MFDFASPWRTEGARNGNNDKGLVTYDRKARKDANTVIGYYANLDGVTVTLNGQT
jgi:hypothetical protein